jgi:hypothetical protein
MLLLLDLAASLFGVMALIAGGSPVIVIGLALLLFVFLFVISASTCCSPTKVRPSPCLAPIAAPIG